MNKLKLSITNALVVSLFLSISTPAFAQSATPSASANTGNSAVTTIISKGNEDIKQRIASLATEQSKIQDLKHLSDKYKVTFTTQIQSQQTALSQQQQKLDADTDLKTAQADRHAIFTHYRIYLLFIPKSHILVATDSMSDITDAMSSIATKFQEYSTKKQSEGVDVSNVTTIVTDLQSKIVSAKSHYIAAQNIVAPLVPDQGSQTVLDSNLTFLKNARSEVKSGADDIKKARADIQAIWTILKVLLNSPTANPLASPGK